MCRSHGRSNLYLLSSRYLDVTLTVQRKAVQTTSNLSSTHCKPYLPASPTLLEDAFRADPGFNKRCRLLDHTLRARLSVGDTDSLAAGIVGSTGLLWSNGYGISRANESDATEPPNEHSIHRIASVSKLFTTLEIFIQRDRGDLNWGDSVTRFYPNYTYKSYGWLEHRAHEDEVTTDAKHPEPITLRQHATHMSGIGCDYPPDNLEDWLHAPPSLSCLSSPGLFFTPEGTCPQKHEIFQTIAENPLVTLQYLYSICSNAGYSLLGWCNSVADSVQTGKSITYAEFVKRDIFEPLEMNGGSFFLRKNMQRTWPFPRSPQKRIMI